MNSKLQELEIELQARRNAIPAFAPFRMPSFLTRWIEHAYVRLALRRLNIFRSEPATARDQKSA